MTTRAEQFPVVGKKPILFLLLIFFLPPIIAALFYGFSAQLSLQSKNFGLLLPQPIPLHTLALRGWQGKPFAFEAIQARWILIYLPEGSCLEPCRRNLQDLQQIRQALGKDYPRTRLLLLLHRDQLEVQQNGFSLVSASVAFIDADARALFFQANPANEQAGFFLADEAGKVIMRFPEPLNQQAVFDDIRWLLKVNQSAIR